MDKVGQDEDKTIEEGSNSVEEMRTHKEDERNGGIIAEEVDPVDSIEEGSTDPSNFHTEEPDFSESEMEDEKVLEFFRRNNSVRPEVAERNNFPCLNNSVQEEVTPAETEQTNFLNLNSQEILEGIKLSSASNEDTDDSSSDSDFNSSPSRYYFDGSLPVSAHVEESETGQDENEVPLLRHKQPMQQPTSWRNCCGLLQFLRAANLCRSGTRNFNLR